MKEAANWAAFLQSISGKPGSSFAEQAREYRVSAARDGGL